MFTNNYLKSLSLWMCNDNTGLIPVTNPSSQSPHTGSTYYINKLSRTLSFTTIRGTNVQNSGVYVTDDDAEYTDDFGAFTVLTGITMTAATPTYSVSNDKYIETITYTITNTTDSDISFKKFVVSESMPSSLTKGSYTSSNCTTICFLHEFETPIVVSPDEPAIIQLVIESY